MSAVDLIYIRIRDKFCPQPMTLTEADRRVLLAEVDALRAALAEEHAAAAALRGAPNGRRLPHRTACKFCDVLEAPQ